MKLKLDFRPDIAALMQAEVAAGQKAVSTAMRDAGTSPKSAWRGLTTVPIFLLVPQVKLRKRLNLARDVEKAVDGVGADRGEVGGREGVTVLWTGFDNWHILPTHQGAHHDHPERRSDRHTV